MAAITRPNYMRSDELTLAGYDTTESTAAPLLKGTASLLGPAGLFEVRAKKHAGGADDSVIRVYTADPASPPPPPPAAPPILIYEQTHSFSADGDWAAFQLVRDEIVAAGEQPHVTVQAGAGTGHEVRVWVSLTVAAVQ